MQVAQVEWGSPFYQMTIELRNEILRKPLGLTFSPKDLASEKETLHFAILNEETSAIAAVCAQALSPRQWKIRQMAVALSHQKKGLGSQLIKSVLNTLIEKDAEEIILHAREIAIPFYEKHGFTSTGPIFTEVGIPHRKMKKNL